MCGKPETEEHNEYLSSSLRQKSRDGEMRLEEEILNSGLLKGRAAPHACKVVSMYELASAAVTNQMCNTWGLPDSSLEQKSVVGGDGVRSAGQVLAGGSTGSLLSGLFQLLRLQACLVHPLHPFFHQPRRMRPSGHIIGSL